MLRDPLSDVWSAKWRAPFAVLGIKSSGTHITGVAFLPSKSKEAAPADALSARAIRELEQYLKDPQTPFTLPLLPHGTLFQQKVWQALRGIPCGQTRTYKEIAAVVKSAARPVGGACAANPIALIIPCHRVVGGDSLGGFMNADDGDPLMIKKWLLRFEGVLPADEA